MPLWDRYLSRENVDGCLEVGLSKRENASECPVVPAAPPLRSRLCERTRFMSLNSESSQGDCTISSISTVGVPSPQNGVAVETQTGDEVPLEAFKRIPSISNLTKGALSHYSKAKIEYSNRTKQNQTNHLPITKNYLQGSLHQADAIFGKNAGRQCVSNCLIAVAFNSKKSANEWDATDMDNILMTGNELYSYLQASSTIQQTYLLINELPRNLEVFNNTFIFYFEEAIATIVGYSCDKTNWQEFNASPLYETLQISLMENDACFVCFAGSTMLVGRMNERFFIFDSHSRSQRGLVDVDGKSTCVFIDDIQTVYLHIQELANSMNIVAAVECEVTGVKVQRQHRQPQHEELGDLRLVHVSTIQPAFIPLTANLQKNLCEQLSIPYFETSSELFSGEKAGQPDACYEIDRDGNCFFRAISFAISNTESNHMEVRKSVCNFAMKEKELMQPVLRSEFDSVKSYIETSCMVQDGIWATEFEIVCTSFLLQCDIYTFSETKWLKYSAAQWDPSIEMLPCAIFLDHAGECHYNVVLSTLQEVIKTSPAILTEETNNTTVDHNNKTTNELSFSHRVVNNNLKSKYNTDPEYRAKIQAKCRVYQRQKYANNLEYRQTKRELNKRKYHEDLAYKEKLKEGRKRKYMMDCQFKECILKASKEKYKKDENFQERKKTKSKQQSMEKYKKNEEFKEKAKNKSREKYQTDVQFKQNLIKKILLKYRKNRTFNEKVKQRILQKYKNDKKFKQNVKTRSIQKYNNDKMFKQNVKMRSIQKYKNDKMFKQNVKMRSIQKYNNDNIFKEKVKLQSKLKYKTDNKHKEMLKEVNKKKYKVTTEQTPEIRKIFAAKTSKRREYKRTRNIGMKNVLSFRTKAAKGPVCACACCQRLLFEDQVQTCQEDVYQRKSAFIGKRAKSAISKRVLHTCTEECPEVCSMSKVWICKTCHNKLLRGDIPPESTINSLELEEIPKELAVLNNLEQHLVALHIPFMKVVSLPKGGQNAVHGPVVCVPSNMSKASSLPRGEDTDMILRVKLKRKLCYKGYYEYQFVNTNNVQTALEYLKTKNKWYSCVRIHNDTANNTESSLDFEIEKRAKGKDKVLLCKDNSPKHIGKESNINNKTDVAESEKEQKEEENTSEENGVQYDTCLQPADVGQEVLDHYFDDIYHLAPAEGMNPVKLLQEKGNEGKSFPVHFPSGKNTFDEKRHLKLSLGRYFNLRLMNADNRFAQDTNYIFYSQYLSELKQVIDKTQISLRKSTSPKNNGDQICAKSIKTTSELQTLIRKDEALRFLQPIRGTPSYWQSAQKDLFAMLRQLGIPTWFCSFSAAGFRWPDIINAILKQQGDKRQAENLDWTEKSRVLKSNPVTVARMFDHRFHIFLRDVILSPAKPIGHVIDYFYRVEFQQRGSPHMHCLFWVKDAPKLSEDDPSAVCDFIDQYVTCKLPSKSDDLELHDIVSSVQLHSKNHSKSCKKKGNVCRFNFPRPPSQQTFISTKRETELQEQISDITSTVGNAESNGELQRSTAEQNAETELNEQKADAAIECACDSHAIDGEQEHEMTEQEAKELLSIVWNAVLSLDKISTCEQLFQKLGIDQMRYQAAHDILTRRQCVVLQRDPHEVWINQYNPHLLRCWDANMDIQFVLDPFSCIVYIISYISKAEREMGMLLRQTKLESEEGNMNAKQTMKAIGSAYLHHREVGVQEAVYRVCGLHMKECSRMVVFIPVGENPTRLTKPLSQIKRKRSVENGKKNENIVVDDDNEDHDDDDDIFMTNIVERYQSRPLESKFEKLCLAEFCSAYRVLANSQIPKGKTIETVHQLQNGKGFIQKRSRSNPAIIRYPRFNEVRQPEEYHQSILQLFLPYWTLNHLKPSGFHLYQTFYELGYVQFKGDERLSRVKTIVDDNHSKFVLHEKDIEEAQEYVDLYGVQEDAWAQLCPESELQRHECQLERTNPSNFSDGKEEIRDMENEAVKTSDIPYHVTKSNTSREDILPILRSLNKEQKQIFYFVRDWCLQTTRGNKPEPFHIFVTGGAGTGKSHLIKAVEYEATRLLSKSCSLPDKQTVLLTAFTGTAAFNIRGCTIHHAFKFNRGFPIPYEPLKEQPLNTLRAALDELQILIIDEISMVYKRLLYYIHERLVQIKKKKSPFGGVSVIAVGDFYQLPPVKQSKSERLYNESGSYPVDYWKELFSIIQLNEIMRQREDLVFAQMLNSMRTRTSDMSFPKEVRDMLLECTREGPSEVLHVYATNKEVNKYNIDMLKSVCSDYREILANDFKKDKTTGKLKKIAKPSSSCDTDSLHASLLLAEGARVMLTRNVDVSDGLVNGATGTVTSFKSTTCNKQTAKDHTEMKAIEVKFDNRHVGKKTGKEYADGNRVCIERIEEEMRKSSITRHQFPLKLAWACTAHKVQGMTTDKVVVNLDNIFSPGQAYVALSRVTSKKGLYIEANNEKEIETRIYADKEVDTAIQSMPRLFGSTTEDSCPQSAQHIEIILFNVQSLRHNIQELRADTRFHSVDIICFTETWLKKEDSASAYPLNGFTCYHRSRKESYEASSEEMSKHRSSRGGGVAMYIRTGMSIEIERFPVRNIEGMMCKICEEKIRLILIYRPSVYSLDYFICNLVNLLQYIGQLSDINGTIVMGDFNENVLITRGRIQSVMERHGFQQTITSVTTEQGTLIDHVYISGKVQGSFSVIPTFYSYHEAILSKIEILPDLVSD